MITVNRSSLPMPEADFRAKYNAYYKAIADHARTENVAAPWPEFEVFRDILAAGGFVVYDDIMPAIHAMNAQATQIRKSTYRPKRFLDRRPK